MDGELWGRGAFTDVANACGQGGEVEGKAGRGEGAEEDAAGAAGGGGWGLHADALEALCADPPPSAVAELEARLSAFLAAANDESGGVLPCRMPGACFGDAVPPLAANAPVAADGGDAYGWHIDADPALLPPSPWTDCYGRYPNRAPGRPRFVTALVYLNRRWPEGWGAPTRFLDPPTGEVVSVAPAPGRLILMDQDISHAVTPPAAAAGESPRYSLVCKLVLHPRAAVAPDAASASVPAGPVRIAPRRFGEPSPVGSAVAE